MFGDDFFGGGIEDLFRKLSGDSFVEYTTIGPDGKKRTSRRMQKDVFGKALLDKVLAKRRMYFIFDFTGRENVIASIKDELITNDYGEKVATGKKILEVKEGNKVISEYPLSSNIKINKFESTFENGILEVSFRK